MFCKKNRKNKLKRYGDKQYNNSSQISNSLLKKTTEEWDEITEKRESTCMDRYDKKNLDKLKNL